MEALKINFWKITGIVLFCSLFATIIHVLWTPLFDYNGPKSFIIDILLVPTFDILSVIIGVFVFEKFNKALRPKVKPSRFYQRQFPLPVLYTGAKPWIGEREL